MRKAGILASVLAIVILMGVAYVSADYTGQMSYMPGYEYNVYVNELSNLVSFTNQLNPGEVYASYYNIGNSFNKRINYVWFNGWIYNNQMFVNQYVGTPVGYSPPTVETSSGIYETEFSFDMNNYFGSQTIMPIGVIFNKNTGVITAYPKQFPNFVLQSRAELNSGAIAVGPVMFQISLDDLNGTLHIQEWAKESTEWVLPLTHI